MSCSQATHYSTRAKTAALDAYQSDPENASTIIANPAALNRWTRTTNQVYTLLCASVTHLSLLCLPSHSLLYFTFYDLHCILFHFHLYIRYRLHFLWLLRFDVCNFPPTNLVFPRAIVTNVKCKLVYVILFILILVFTGFVCSNSYSKVSFTSSLRNKRSLTVATLRFFVSSPFFGSA